MPSRPPSQPGIRGGKTCKVTCLDFASLYPSIMRQHCTCTCSLISDTDRPRMLMLVSQNKHPPIKAVPYTRKYNCNNPGAIYMLGPGCSTVVQPDTAYFAVMDIKDTIMLPHGWILFEFLVWLAWLVWFGCHTCVQTTGRF
jgi:hypothetical protein